MKNSLFYYLSIALSWLTWNGKYRGTVARRNINLRWRSLSVGVFRMRQAAKKGDFRAVRLSHARKRRCCISSDPLIHPAGGAEYKRADVRFHHPRCSPFTWPCQRETEAIYNVKVAFYQLLQSHFWSRASFLLHNVLLRDLLQIWDGNAELKEKGSTNGWVLTQKMEASDTSFLLLQRTFYLLFFRLWPHFGAIINSHSTQ